MAPENLTEAIMKLHKRLKKEPPNCRGKKTGDSGKMYSLGKRNEELEYCRG